MHAPFAARTASPAPRPDVPLDLPARFRSCGHVTKPTATPSTLQLIGAPPVVFFSNPAAIKQIFSGNPEHLRAGQANRVSLEHILGPNQIFLRQPRTPAGRTGQPGELGAHPGPQLDIAARRRSAQTGTQAVDAAVPRRTNAVVRRTDDWDYRSIDRFLAGRNVLFNSLANAANYPGNHSTRRFRSG